MRPKIVVGSVDTIGGTGLLFDIIVLIVMDDDARDSAVEAADDDDDDDDADSGIASACSMDGDKS